MEIQVTPKAINAGGLYYTIHQSIASFEGVATGGGQVRLIFADNASQEDIAAAIVLYNQHDPNVLSPSQQTAATSAAELLDVTPAQVAGALTQIGTDITECDTDMSGIASDVTALAAAATLGAVKPIVANILTRQQNSANRQKRILQVLQKVVKALRWLTNQALS